MNFGRNNFIKMRVKIGKIRCGLNVLYSWLENYMGWMKVDLEKDWFSY